MQLADVGKRAEEETRLDASLHLLEAGLQCLPAQVDTREVRAMQRGGDFAIAAKLEVHGGDEATVEKRPGDPVCKTPEVSLV